MWLMKYAPTDWLDVVAMRMDGVSSSWVNAVLQEVANGRRQAFRTWGQFKVAMIHRFESITETEDARRQLRALKQTSRVNGYIQHFQELQYRLPSMTDEEAFHAFLSGLVPICKNMGEPMSRMTWRRQWRWPNGWKHTEEVRGPKPVEAKGPENLKNKTSRGV